MLWALDEVTQTCPLPLPSMLADAGGRGIQIMPVVHGAAQLRTRWGRDGARDHPGHRQHQGVPARHQRPGDAGAGLASCPAPWPPGNAARSTTSRHPVMTEDMISRLPARRDGTGYAFILRDGLTPVIARPPVIWHGRLAQAAHPPPLHRYQPALPVRAAASPRPGRTTWPGTTPSPQPAAALAPAPAAPAGHAWHNGNGQPAAAPASSPAGPGPRGHGTGSGGRRTRSHDPQGRQPGGHAPDRR